MTNVNGKALREPDRRFGQAFWIVIGLLQAREFKSRGALAKEVIGAHGRPLTRQRVRAIINDAVDAGILDKDPFGKMPAMARPQREA